MIMIEILMEKAPEQVFWYGPKLVGECVPGDIELEKSELL